MKTLIESAAAAKAASTAVAQLTTEQKNAALLAMADALEAQCAEILAANRADMERERANGMSEDMLDRLMLNEKRVADMALGLRQVAELPDPVGEVMADWTRPNGLQHPQGPRADGRHRHNLRGEAQRHGRRRVARLQGRQRHTPARQRLGLRVQRRRGARHARRAGGLRRDARRRLPGGGARPRRGRQAC